MPSTAPEAGVGLVGAGTGPAVVKLGGAVAADGRAVVAGLASLPVCVVHGAGPQISEEMTRQGVEVRFVDGRRVTDQRALEVVRASLLEVNRRVCRALGAAAVGLMGDEIGMKARHLPELGYVGEAEPSRPQAVVGALEQGRIPVVAPLASGPLNVHADEAAAALAVGMGAALLVFVTDVPGVLVAGSVAPEIDLAEAQHLLDGGAFQGGIVPKLRAAVAAAADGIEVRIGATAIRRTA
jgi:acetylglutamate kinase